MGLVAIAACQTSPEPTTIKVTTMEKSTTMDKTTAEPEESTPDCSNVMVYESREACMEYCKSEGYPKMKFWAENTADRCAGECKCGGKRVEAIDCGDQMIVANKKRCMAACQEKNFAKGKFFKKQKGDMCAGACVCAKPVVPMDCTDQTIVVSKSACRKMCSDEGFKKSRFFAKANKKREMCAGACLCATPIKN
jgi:hypothetical protein